MWKLEKGDIVKCIIPNDNELTLDKEYEILDVDTSISQVEVINDMGKIKSYLWVRFDKEAL
ncbi:hypothetical protein CBG60_00225 [Fusobacterium animalis]|uniref:Uncharacterized protein n=1 Tax=Fusobacterium animalis 7_1 TaxID=457405 RepID=A0A140PU84_9FUSO|nr:MULTISPECIES: hypothetical protein [Fusobacterium]ALF22134.1 hypothetical protein RO08_07400 [Fusobacterium animalis]ASG29848.1 hypothetical protein CBG60_00225 [Fusobacterium animalis]EEO42691.1 hypothetical protein FSDG_01250 [Fusobacterium animalis 7_1]EPC07768.1 hypothetical protein HMPREF9369_02577 [Fusobacterium polymorphum F0401]ERT41377.1 hypothetical protein HMPREF1538_00989 [Fusobacterium nucleatum CTI-1]